MTRTWFSRPLVRFGTAALVLLVLGLFLAPKLAFWVAAAIPMCLLGAIMLLPAMDTTGTFKVRKMDLVADGYDPGKIKGPLYFHDPKKGDGKVTKGVFDKSAAGLVKV